MKRMAMALLAIVLLYGCRSGYLYVNIPPIITFYPTYYRDERTNKGAMWLVCGGRSSVVNDSSAKLYVGKGGYAPYAPNRVFVAEGIPHEHIVVQGYDQYGELVGWAERTFICTGPPQRWAIKDWTLWWDHR